MDTRIFYRYCQSLSKYYAVELIACHPKKEVVKGITITPYPRYKNRVVRVLFSWLLLLPKAFRAKAALYHLHDPELIPLGLILRLYGKKVIYDIHENIAEDIFDKEWIRFKKVWYSLYNFFEKPALKRFHIILAEDSYLKRYQARTKNCLVIHNFCDLPFFRPFITDTADRDPFKLFYIGILLENRGILEILEAMHLAKKKGYSYELHVVAELYTQVSDAVVALPFFEEIKHQVIFYGRKNLEEGYQISKQCGIGLCIIHPMSNSIESYPTKLFEYMAVGLPIVTSHFPLYKSVVEENKCGYTADPKNPDEILESMLRISLSKDQNEMATNGRKAVEKKYNWQNEEPNLIKLYKNILSRES